MKNLLEKILKDFLTNGVGSHKVTFIINIMITFIVN